MDVEMSDVQPMKEADGTLDTVMINSVTNIVKGLNPEEEDAYHPVASDAETQSTLKVDNELHDFSDLYLEDNTRKVTFCHMDQVVNDTVDKKAEMDKNEEANEEMYSYVNPYVRPDTLAQISIWKGTVADVLVKAGDKVKYWQDLFVVTVKTRYPDYLTADAPSTDEDDESSYYTEDEESVDVSQNEDGGDVEEEEEEEDIVLRTMAKIYGPLPSQLSKSSTPAKADFRKLPVLPADMQYVVIHAYQPCLVTEVLFEKGMRVKKMRPLFYYDELNEEKGEYP